MHVNLSWVSLSLGMNPVSRIRKAATHQRYELLSMIKMKVHFGVTAMLM